MSLSSGDRQTERALLVALLLTVAGSGCAASGSERDASVARGHYYASGEPYYDQFFIGLYMLQKQMVDAPRVPLGERQSLAHLIGLPRSASESELSRRLRLRAEELTRGGTELRLDLDPVGQSGALRAVIRSNARPSEGAAATLLNAVEESAQIVNDSIEALKRADDALGRLEQDRASLAARVEPAFADAGLRKQSEVKRNLADAQP